jgi:hypothetical protein
MSTECESPVPKYFEGIDERTTAQRLRNADETLLTAGRGLELLEHWEFTTTDTEWIVEVRQGRVRQLPLIVRNEARERLISGLRIMVVFGPATTLALQSLSSVEPGFADWWAPRSRALRADPLARFFWEMRVALAHRGSAGMYNTTTRYNAVQLDDDDATPSGHIALEFLNSPRGKNADAYALGVEYMEMIGTVLAEAWYEFAPGESSTSPAQPLDVPSTSASLKYTDADGSSSEYQLVRMPAEHSRLESVIPTDSDDEPEPNR